MAVQLRIYSVDDPQQQAVLRTKTRKVQKVTPKLLSLAEQMLETMHEANGVGLAANQVGMPQRFFVAELPADEENDVPAETFIVFNPEIVKKSGEQVAYEGCLSIVGYVGQVARAEKVLVRGLDVHGQPVRFKAEGYLARVFQHEIDHLDGMLYTDRLTDPSSFHPVPTAEEAEEAEDAAEAEPAPA